MRETYMHVAGVVATDPTIRKFDDGRHVLSFRVASTSRRYDTNAKDWVDGPTLWVKVSCWRELAENAAHSVRKRDRVVAWGKVRTEQWKGEDGGQRSDLALDAEALGHDLAFGTAEFRRKQRTVSTRTLTAEGVVDEATGELVPAAETEPVVVLPAQVGADLDADPDAELDAELDEEVDEEIDDRPAVLASA